MSASLLDLSLVNAYLAHKQHLSPSKPGGDMIQITRDIVALHATGATGPYLSLWARMPGFERRAFEDALVEGNLEVQILFFHPRPDDMICTARCRIQVQGAFPGSLWLRS